MFLKFLKKVCLHCVLISSLPLKIIPNSDEDFFLWCHSFIHKDEVYPDKYQAYYIYEKTDYHKVFVSTSYQRQHCFTIVRSPARLVSSQFPKVWGVSSTGILMMQGQSGSSIHRGGGTLQDYKNRFCKNLFWIFVAGPSQMSGILKFIVLEAIYRVKEDLDRHLSEGAVTACDCVQAVSAMAAQKENL